MNKIKFLTAAAILSLSVFSSCEDGKFGGDEVPGSVALKDMCGTWSCTVEANDAWFTMLNYAEDYDPGFINEYFGDPYGNYNPDTNGDNIVDEKDFGIYTEEDLWWDEYEVGVVEFNTANTADNNTTEMVLQDNFWNEVFKVNVDCKSKTFSAGKVINDPYEVLSVTPATVSNTYDNDGAPVVIGGKILPNAATAPGSGMKRDSIIFYIKYADDMGQDLYYKVSGYRKTGYTED